MRPQREEEALLLALRLRQTALLTHFPLSLVAPFSIPRRSKWPPISCPASALQTHQTHHLGGKKKRRTPSPPGTGCTRVHMSPTAASSIPPAFSPSRSTTNSAECPPPDHTDSRLRLQLVPGFSEAASDPIEEEYMSMICRPKSLDPRPFFSTRQQSILWMLELRRV